MNSVTSSKIRRKASAGRSGKRVLKAESRGGRQGPCSVLGPSFPRKNVTPAEGKPGRESSLDSGFALRLAGMTEVLADPQSAIASRIFDKSPIHSLRLRVSAVYSCFLQV